MPAGYQITQQKHPVAHSGYFDFYVHSDQKVILELIFTTFELQSVLIYTGVDKPVGVIF